jgi:hypothetical protein
MNDSSNLSLLDHQVDQSDVAIQIATNNAFFGLPTVTPEKKEDLTNVLSGDESYNRKVSPQASPMVDDKKNRRGSLGRVIKFIKKPFTGRKPSDSPISTSQTIPAANHISNPKHESYEAARHHLISILSKGDNSPGEIELLQKAAIVFADLYHGPVDEAIVSKDFTTLVNAIRRLREKIGLPELVVMILLALIVKNKLYKDIGIKSAAGFFRLEAETMGISSSRARDYSIRGVAFMDYRKDILEGSEEISGISLDDFVKLHMSKLTLYARAVEKFGRKGALVRFKELSFREFQKELAVKEPSDIPQQKQSANSASVNEAASAHDNQKAMILELNLSPQEKRAWRIIAKGGIYCMTKGLRNR